MGSRLAIGTGLVAGILVGGLAVGGVVALLPAPAAPAITAPAPIVYASPSPTPARTSAPSPSAAASAAASPPAPASPSAAASTPPLPSPTSSQGFGIGQLAPALRLPKASGGTLDLATLRGKPVWLNFMATWCPECRTELPLMTSFQARYAKAGLTVIVVDVKEPGTDVAGYLQALGVPLPIVLDDSGATAARWRALALPMHFWLSADGTVAAGAAGSVSAEQMAADLSKILPGVTVTP